jgi:DNA-binding PadR family transcriptional regulator
MVKNVLLGLLTRGPKHGYELKRDFEDLLGGTWEINLGQVYLTLGRLERDGLVSSDIVPQDTRPDRKVYTITELGRKELDRWSGEPVADPVHLRDELILKVLVQALLESDDTQALVWGQRQRHVELLSELTALRDEPGQPRSTTLLLEAGIAHIEADLKWLDIVEQTLVEGGQQDDRRS